MSWGMQYPVQILSAVFAKMLHSSDTGVDNAGLSCCWICQTDPWIHIETNRLSWWRMRIALCMFVFLPLLNIFMPRDQCGWQTQLHVCVEHVEGRRECVCPPMHDMQPGQMTPLAKWLFYTACTWKGGHFCLLFDTKGWRGRREDVCEIHHTAASLAQRSVTPTSSSRSPPAPSYLLSSELCMLACFVQLFPMIHTSKHRDRLRDSLTSRFCLPMTKMDTSLAGASNKTASTLGWSNLKLPCVHHWCSWLNS